MPGVWQLVEAEHEASAAWGQLSGILPPTSGWAALLPAKALLAKLAAPGMKILATVALRLPASTALWEALPATHPSPMMGHQAE